MCDKPCKVYINISCKNLLYIYGKRVNYTEISVAKVKLIYVANVLFFIIVCDKICLIEVVLLLLLRLDLKEKVGNLTQS